MLVWPWPWNTFPSPVKTAPSVKLKLRFPIREATTDHHHEQWNSRHFVAALDQHDRGVRVVCETRVRACSLWRRSPRCRRSASWIRRRGSSWSWSQVWRPALERQGTFWLESLTCFSNIHTDDIKCSKTCDISGLATKNLNQGRLCKKCV